MHPNMKRSLAPRVRPDRRECLFIRKPVNVGAVTHRTNASRGSAVLVTVAALLVLIAGAPTATAALPRSRPDATWMVDGTVYAIARSGSNIWVGGTFTQVLDEAGVPVRSVDNLAVFDTATGRIARRVHIPKITGVGAVVHDLSVTSRGRVYVAGRFDAIDGAPRTNVASFNGATGTVGAFAAPVDAAKSVYATTRRVYVGGMTLRSFRARGQENLTFQPPAVEIDDSLRGHRAAPAFRDITIVGTDLVAACTCDRINGVPVKALVKLDATTGALGDWRPSNLPETSAALGLRVLVEPATDEVFLAAGGSDFVASYALSTGQVNWREDTSGSAQTIVRHDNRLIVGGHFERVGQLGSGNCGSNQVPEGDCWFQPRLFAIRPGTGLPDMTWTPSLGPQYPGVWALLSAGRQLHVGGTFTRVGNRDQRYYARFSRRP